MTGEEERGREQTERLILSRGVLSQNKGRAKVRAGVKHVGLGEKFKSGFMRTDGGCGRRTAGGCTGCSRLTVRCSNLGLSAALTTWSRGIRENNHQSS